MIYVISFIDIRKRLPEWGISSAGRAPALHAGGQRFDPAILHHLKPILIYKVKYKYLKEVFIFDFRIKALP